MTELDVYQAMLSSIEYAQGVGEMMFTLMAGYLLVAFFIGKRLTTFQVLFLSAVFLMMYASAASSMMDAMEKVTHFRLLLVAMGSDIPNSGSFFQRELAGSYALLLVPLLVVMGSYYFMWSIRHPKVK